MKPKVCYFLLFALIPLSLFSQPWFTRITPFPQENSLNYITKVPYTNHHIVAVGNRSTVLISDNFVNFWDVRYNPGGLDNQAVFSYVCFIDSLTGFISGNRGILKTSDGGDSWTLVYSNGSDYSYDDIAFVNETTGFAVGNGDNILKTADGGESWEIIESGVTFDLYQIEFFDESTGIITGNSTEKILKTTDSGATWEQIDYPSGLPDSYISSLYLVNDQKGFAFVYDQSSYTGFLMRTNDSGVTWDTAYSNPAFFSGHIDFSNEYWGALAPGSFYSNLVVTTNDGGETWTEHAVPGIEGVSDNYICYNGNSIYITGLSGKIFRSSDNGVTWERLDSRIFYGDIYQMQFLDDNTGFALSTDYGSGVASSGLFKTENGGETWTGIANLMNSNGAFCFTNESTGMYCYEGIGITIAKTEDGGETWTSTDFTDITLSPYVMKFFDDNNGLIAGEGPVLRTTDAGETWQEISWNNGNFNEISDIFYKSENEVFITGEALGSGTFVGKSVDGGETWEVTDLGNYGGGKSIAFTDENTAFIACGNTTILKSTDGGETWAETAVNTSNYIEFKQISFPSVNTGYAVGDGNYENFFMTTDGGETWNPLNSGCSASFSSMHFFNENNGLVGGGMGVLFRVSDEQIQFNPPQNIDGWQDYVCPINYYYIYWDAPDTTNAPDLIEYKIFRNGNLIESIPVSGFYNGSFVDEVYPNTPGAGEDFCYSITAVYSNPSGESIHTDDICFSYLTNVNDSSIDMGLNITPNPSSGEIQIGFKNVPGNDILISIFDLSGKEMLREIINRHKKIVSLDISVLEPGVYLCNVNCGFRSGTLKIIKK